MYVLKRLLHQSSKRIPGVLHSDVVQIHGQHRLVVSLCLCNSSELDKSVLTEFIKQPLARMNDEDFKLLGKKLLEDAEEFDHANVDKWKLLLDFKSYGKILKRLDKGQEKVLEKFKFYRDEINEARITLGLLIMPDKFDFEIKLNRPSASTCDSKTGRFGGRHLVNMTMGTQSYHVLVSSKTDQLHLALILVELINWDLVKIRLTIQQIALESNLSLIAPRKCQAKLSI